MTATTERLSRTPNAVQRHACPVATDAGADSAHASARGYGAVMCTAATALALCCVLTSAKKYFWYDEVSSANLVADPSLAHMLGTVAAGSEGAPPLYHTLLWLWTRVVGRSELALRVPSCAALIVALLLVWTTLRRWSSLRASTFGTLTGFTMSGLVLYHVAEARFYGLLTALVAGAVALGAWAMRSERLSRTFVVAMFATHVALVYVHVYGSMYSAALLAAWIVADRCRGWWRPRAYAAVPIAWATFVPWLPFLRNAANLARPRGWIAPPTGGALVHVYAFAIPRLAFLLIGLTLLSCLGGLAGEGRGGAEPSDRASRRRRMLVASSLVVAIAGIAWLPSRVSDAGASVGELVGQSSGLLVLALAVAVVASGVRRAGGLQAAGRSRPLIIIAVSLLAVPLGAFIISRLVTPIFVDRYMLPSTIGLSILVAEATDHLALTFHAADAGRAPRTRAVALRVVWGGLLALMAVHPVWTGLAQRPGERPGAQLEQLAPQGAVVVVPSVRSFLPILYYQRRPDIQYVFPTDREVFLDPRASKAALYNYNFVTMLVQRHELAPVVPTAASPLCTYSGLIVARPDGTKWFAVRVASDSTLDAEPILAQGAPRGAVIAWLVRPRSANTLRPCVRGVTSPA